MHKMHLTIPKGMKPSMGHGPGTCAKGYTNSDARGVCSTPSCGCPVQALHSAGLVHRDVKPLNIIFAEQQRRFKLIDLGACADLRTGTNYTPDESILDPNYCPPEQVLLRTLSL